MRGLYYFLRVAAIMLHLMGQALGALLWLLWECLLGLAHIVASIWVGIPTAVSRMARKWTDEAIRRGFDTRYSDYLYKAFWVVAFIATVAGWIGYSYLTVFVVNWLLHR